MQGLGECFVSGKSFRDRTQRSRRCFQFAEQGFELCGEEAIQLRGMRPFVTHEAIAKSVFNRGYTSGVGELEAWRHQLSNLDDDRLESGIN